MSQTKHRKTSTWRKIAHDYNKLIVPNRPSSDDCKNYGTLITQFLKKKKKPRIMLMGATPELRQILYTQQYLREAQVYCVDINPKMYQAMSDFVILGRKAKERFVQSSWLKIPFAAQIFDLIVGDEVICNVDQKDHRRLFQEVKRLLKNDGSWITRHNVYLPETRDFNIREILLDLSAKVKRGEYSFQKAMNLLFILSLYYYSAAKLGDNSAPSHLELIKKEYSQSLKNHPDHKIILEIINFYEHRFVPMLGEYHWSVLSQKESEKELKEFFEIKETVYSHDYPTAQNGPIYVLKKK